MTGMPNGHGSFWLHSVPDSRGPRPALREDLDADVVIVGAGLSGLWTAYWHARRAPGSRIVVLEQERVGYGASGRNGGWLSGKTVGQRRRLLAAGHSAAEALAMERRVFDAVREVPEIFERAGKDIDAVRGGWMQIARSESELARMREYVRAERAWGLGEEDITLLSAQEAAGRVNVPGIRGAAYSPHAVRLHPAKLMYALAELCEESGVRIFERSRAEEIAPGLCRTAGGSVRAPVTVLATEGYTAALPGRRRELLPMLSSMVVTDPLSPDQWERIGWEAAECMSGAQHMYFYAQRTADGRIAMGGRGKPYRWGSALDEDGALDPRTAEQLCRTLQDLFPQVRLSFAHSWCGVLGVTRDWSPFIDVQAQDGGSRLVRLGGYAGQGVTAAYLAARTAADLIAGEDTELTRSTWARPLPRKWEPEPLRWIGANAIYKLYRMADHAERGRGGTATSSFALLGHKLAGRS